MDNTATQQEQATEKTFTQEDVNRIVTDRLYKERQKFEGIDIEALKKKAAKFDEMEEANKTELQKANDRADALKSELDTLKKANAVRDIRDKVAKETGVPYALLTADTEDECRLQAQAVLEYRQGSIPAVRDGGEVQSTGKQSTRDQFAAWTNQVF